MKYTGILHIFNIKPTRVIAYGLTAATLVLVATLIMHALTPPTISLKVGETALTTLTAPRSVQVELPQDKAYNAAAIRRLKQSIPLIYSINTHITKRNINNLEQALMDINHTPYEKLGHHLTQFLTRNDITLLQKLNTEKRTAFQSRCLQAARTILAAGIKNTINRTEEQLIREHLALFSPALQTIAITLIHHYTEPNLRLDKEQSDRLVEQALHSYAHKKSSYRRGEPIIYENETVTPSHIEVFKALNMYQHKKNPLRYLGIYTLCALCLLVIERFIALFYAPEYTITTYCLILISSLLILVGAYIPSLLPQIPPSIPAYLFIPIPLASMILTGLLSSPVSLLTGSLLSVLIGIMYQPDYSALLFLFFTSCFSSFIVARYTKRSELIIASYLIGLCNMCVLGCIGFLSLQASLSWYAMGMLLAFSNGVLSAMIYLAILPYIEQLFNVTSTQQLSELATLTHPLLKRLMIDAPGTYQHSLVVANFAEAAAEKIGANPLLCRVGSYFHDIGKLKRPLFFSENQFSSTNPHEKLAPRVSASLITAHVTDGLMLAKKHKLPPCLCDIIEQHHGTSLLHLFYTQEQHHSSSATDDNAFRYPGPLPTTKEAGIVMLADTIEAAARALPDPTPEKIDALISKLIKEKCDEKQLIYCPISLKDIHIIGQTIAHLLRSLSHSRLDYDAELAKLTPATHNPPH